jgi:hypothetical protein
MTGKLIRNRWPRNTADRIEKMLAAKKTWPQMAVSFGCSTITIRNKAVDLGLYTPKKLRRFTPEDDAIIRADYLANADLELTAQKIGCSYGVLKQRIHLCHHDIVRTVRSAHGTLALKRYGQELLRHGATAGEAAANLRQKIIDAKTVAKVTAIRARKTRREQMLDDMMSEINEGKDRNTAIFEARMLGLHLEEIAGRLNITRERVRQICNKVAFDAAVKQQLNGHGIPPESERQPS